ncbi:MAG TPA: hypothetical protein VN836_12240 [Verrucomicrobiae bacterium]|nr:hypothetical protein [Verrucomicrobiae bacterium]
MKQKPGSVWAFLTWIICHIGFMPNHKPDDDPLGLEPVDREIRLEKLRYEIQEAAGTKTINGKMANCDPEVEEAFLEHVLALETHGFVSPFDTLVRQGFDLPAPEKLDDTTLVAKLQDLIHALAAHRLFLHSTDHLSDRELYTWLRSDGLREELMGFDMPIGNCHLDVLGACTETDIILQMRYYADDAERAGFAADFPDFPMPPREKPPYDRDRHLPQAPI